jgi:uncharacterized membrane protein
LLDKLIEFEFKNVIILTRETGDIMSTKKIVINAILSAVIMVSTFYVNIPILPSTGGLIHLGNIFIFLIALVLGIKYSFAGAIGLTLFDLVSGYAIWAPITFITRLLMGVVVSKLGYRQSNYPKLVLAQVAGAIVVVSGYYFYEALFITNFATAILSATADSVTLAISIVVVTALYPFVLGSIKKLNFEF